MGLRYMLVVLVAAGVSVASESPAEHRPRDPDLPCPDAMLIKPCTCHINNMYFMTLDCSLINTNEDLERVFSNQFPFKNFQQFIINHDPLDPNNRLTEIHSDIFQELVFERVTIMGTQLETIDENVFSYSHDSLKALNLQNNRIREFPFESIGLYNKLTTLLLDDNELPRLEKFISKSLTTLSVGGNLKLQFTYDVLEEIPNLENLNMENIGLQTIPQHMFANLTKIYTINFRDNDITKLEEYTLDPIGDTVGRLILSYNDISSALPNALQGLMNNAIVDLSNNDIILMTKHIWQPLFEQVLNGMVDLTGNDLKCGCDMSWMFLNSTDIISSDRYLPILRDHTTCFDGTQVIYLDINVFEKHCT